MTHPLNQFTAASLLEEAIAQGWRTTYNEALWDWLTANGYTQNSLNDKVYAAFADGFDFSSFGFNPLTLFASGEKGVWYDPSDFSTLYQDSTGTTPVTAVGQPVELMLDKSQGLVLGPELVTTTALTPQNANGTVTVDGSSVVCLCTTNGLYGARFNPTPGTALGKSYQVIVTVSQNSANKQISFDFGGSGRISGAAVTTSVGSKQAYAVDITGQTLSVYIATGLVGESFTISLVSVRELPGNHAYQATSTSRPVLQVDGNGKHYLAFDGVDDFMQTAAIDFSANGKLSCHAGVRANNSVGPPGIVGLDLNYSSLSGNWVLQPSFRGILRYGASLNAIPEDAITVTYPTTRVVSLVGEHGVADWVCRVDGVAGTPVASTAQNMSNKPLYLGVSGAAYMSGNLYSLIVRGALSDATQIANAETYVNSKTGAY